MVYHLLKDSQLKQLVKESGLNPKGDRKTLTQRHQRFSVLYNAQCDQVGTLLVHLLLFVLKLRFGTVRSMPELRLNLILLINIYTIG